MISARSAFRQLILIACLSSWPLATFGEIIDRVMAVVNDLIVTQSDMSDFQKKLKSSGLVDESLMSIYDRKKLLSDNAYLLDYLIDERIIDSEITLTGIVSPIEQVESEIRNITRARGIDRNQLKLALKNQGIAYSDYQDFIKTGLQRQNLLQREVTSKIKISDDEVASYYAKTSGQGKALVYEYTLAHIVFLSSNGGEKAALSRAKLVEDKLATGIPFESLAAQYSEDPQFSQGGLFGTFRLTDFNKDISAALTPLNANEVSPVVTMGKELRIFKVLQKTLVPSPDLEARREEIRRHLTSENFKKQFLAWMQQKRKESYLKINAK